MSYYSHSPQVGLVPVKGEILHDVVFFDINQYSRQLASTQRHPEKHHQSLPVMCDTSILTGLPIHIPLENGRYARFSERELAHFLVRLIREKKGQTSVKKTVAKVTDYMVAFYEQAILPRLQEGSFFVTPTGMKELAVLCDYHIAMPGASKNELLRLETERKRLADAMLVAAQPVAEDISLSIRAPRCKELYTAILEYTFKLYGSISEKNSHSDATIFAQYLFYSMIQAGKKAGAVDGYNFSTADKHFLEMITKFKDQRLNTLDDSFVGMYHTLRQQLHAKTPVMGIYYRNGHEAFGQFPDGKTVVQDIPIIGLEYIVEPDIAVPRFNVSTPTFLHGVSR